MTDVLVYDSSMIKIDRYYEKNLVDLVAEVMSKFNSQIKPDAVIIANAYSETTVNQVLLASKISSMLGFSGFTIRIENGDASGGAAIETAYYMIKSGLVKSVLLIGVEKMGDFPTSYLNEIIAENLDEKFGYREGLTLQPFAALQMKQYMKTYGVDYDYFTQWPLAMHKYGSENPFAYLKFQVDKKTIEESQIISEPLRLFDTSPRADGAAAVLLTNEEFKPEIKVKITDVSSAVSEFTTLSMPAVRQAYSRFREYKADFMEIHDSYSINAALILEEIGFEKGKSLNMLDSIQVNYSGGLKSRGYPGGATGIYQLAESFMQLAGSFPGKRAQGEKGVVISTDDLGTSAYVIGLKRC